MGVEFSDQEKGGLEKAREWIELDRDDATSVARYKTSASSERGPTVTEEFISLLTDHRPPDVKSAPPSVELPPSLYEGLIRQMRLAEAKRGTDEWGKEYGGVFGFINVGGERAFTIVCADGRVGEIDYAEARQSYPSAKWLGTFHTHVYKTMKRIEEGKVYGEYPWEGGGHSGDDIRNFFVGADVVSIVIAQTRRGKEKEIADRKIFCLLKPAEWRISGLPIDVGTEYETKVFALVEEEQLDLLLASERQLTGLAQEGAFVFYTSQNSRILVKR